MIQVLTFSHFRTLNMYDGWPRCELQELARERGINANQRSDSLREQLAESDAKSDEDMDFPTSDDDYEKEDPSGVIPGEDLIELVAPLLYKPHQQWEHADVLRLAQRMTGNSCLDGRSSVGNRQGTMQFRDIENDLEEYMASHADIRRLLDPYYVMFDHPLAANFDKAIAAYPKSPLNLADPKLPNIFSFQASPQGRRDAHKLIGHVQALCPGQCVHTFTSVMFSQF
ncbi:unnamed protein product [Aphanomyces euteiches]